MSVVPPPRVKPRIRDGAHHPEHLSFFPSVLERVQHFCSTLSMGCTSTRVRVRSHDSAQTWPQDWSAFPLSLPRLRSASRYLLKTRLVAIAVHNQANNYQFKRQNIRNDAKLIGLGYVSFFAHNGFLTMVKLVEEKSQQCPQARKATKGPGVEACKHQQATQTIILSHIHVGAPPGSVLFVQQLNSSCGSTYRSAVSACQLSFEYTVKASVNSFQWCQEREREEENWEGNKHLIHTPVLTWCKVHTCNQNQPKTKCCHPFDFNWIIKICFMKIGQFAK